MAKILIIDDDREICILLQAVIGKIGHESDCAYSLADGHKKAISEPYDVVFLDVNLPDGNGLSLLSKLKNTPSFPEVIIITGEGGPDGAELAIKNGAWDYIEKPLSIDGITLPLVRALQYRNEKKAIGNSIVLKREGIIGESAKMRYCLDQVAQAAISDETVLIMGETGTGKELFASAIHDNSSRRDNNFVIVDCAALPETLVVSTLFGHVKGAFTGADRDREGLIKQANKGTLFLDEIGELPMSVQKTFLRVLQEKRFRPVGGKEELKSDFRLIAATNRNLEHMIMEERLRQDLLFQIRSLTISLPPLRERVQDIKELSLNIISKACERERIGTKGYSPEFIKTLEAYNWPGNVRELVNALEGAISKARYEPTLFPKHLSDRIRIDLARSTITDHMDRAGKSSDRNITSALSRILPTIKELRETVICENEKKYITELLSVTNGDIKEACRIAGLGRARLYGLMKNYGISRAY
ncbi:MAG: sigma-54-dependent Fis family transcriptional regulator [Deltaproteobacteria bacterium]|nr:sigma-54-dependent Fis family transcriptional regulator [Deltaproteobacteria bacterium]